MSVVHDEAALMWRPQQDLLTCYTISVHVIRTTPPITDHLRPMPTHSADTLFIMALVEKLHKQRAPIKKVADKTPYNQIARCGVVEVGVIAGGPGIGWYHGPPMRVARSGDWLDRRFPLISSLHVVGDKHGPQMAPVVCKKL